MQINVFVETFDDGTEAIRIIHLPNGEVTEMKDGFIDLKPMIPFIGHKIDMFFKGVFKHRSTLDNVQIFEDKSEVDYFSYTIDKDYQLGDKNE